MASKRIKSVKPLKPKIKTKPKVQEIKEEKKDSGPKNRAMQDFLQRLQEVRRHYEVDQIAVNLLVSSSKVESWLKGDDYPKKTIIPVLNNVLRYLLRSHKIS